MEQQVSELFDLLNRYLQAQLQPVPFWQGFINHWIPILQFCVLFVGAGASVWKYFHEKNREIYEKILSEVYAPLYNYIIKQETYRQICMPEHSYIEHPIIELKSSKTTQEFSFRQDEPARITTTKETSKSVLNLDRKEFLSVLNSVNIGLASKELYTLLSVYEVIVYLCESKNKTDERVLKATIIGNDIERRLRREVVTGYKAYHKRLGLNSNRQVDCYTLSEDQVEFDFKVSDEEIKNLREKIKQHPEIYED